MTSTSGETSPKPGYHEEYERLRSEGRFVLPRCAQCGHVFWHPRRHCPMCLSTRIEFTEPDWPATVHTYTVNHRPKKGSDDGGATTVGYIEFEPGVRVLGIIELPDGVPIIGAAVRAQARATDEGTKFVFVADEPGRA